jgi:hypothetical protein
MMIRHNPASQLTSHGDWQSHESMAIQIFLHLHGPGSEHLKPLFADHVQSLIQLQVIVQVIQALHASERRRKLEMSVVWDPPGQCSLSHDAPTTISVCPCQL